MPVNTIKNVKNSNTQETVATKRLHEVDFLRVSAIILVILYHVFRIYDLTELNLPENSTVLKFKWILDHVIAYFRMPLLVFVSGYMFAFLKISKGKYNNSIKLIKSKAKRLLLPYIVFAPITFFCYHLWKLDSMVSFLCPIGHLWFIVMLFWCFSITQLLSTLVNLSSTKILLPLIIALSLCYSLSFLTQDYLGLASCMRWLWCFILGYGAYSLPKSELLRKLPLKYVLCLIILCSIFIVCVNYLSSYNHKVAISLHPLVMALCVLTTWGGVFYVSIKTVPSYFTKIIKCSYGMYVVHMWILSLIFYNADYILSLANGHYVIFGILLFIATVFLSFISSTVILSTKIGRYLIG